MRAGFFGFKILSAGISIILTSITSKCIVENARVVRKVPELAAFFGISSIMHTPTYDMKTPPIRIGGSRVEDGPRLGLVRWFSSFLASFSCPTSLARILYAPMVMNRVS